MVMPSITMDSDHMTDLYAGVFINTKIKVTTIWVDTKNVENANKSEYQVSGGKKTTGQNIRDQNQQTDKRAR